MPAASSHAFISSLTKGGGVSGQKSEGLIHDLG